MDLRRVYIQGVTYADYRNLIYRLFLEGKTIGKTQIEKLVEFTKLNIQRMNRLDRTIQIAKVHVFKPMLFIFQKFL